MEFTHSMRQYHLYFNIKGCLKKNYRPQKINHYCISRNGWISFTSSHPWIVSTHVSIGHTATINDVILHHFVARGSGLFFIYPIRLMPMFGRHQPKLHRSRAENRHSTAKPFVVKENKKTRRRGDWTNRLKSSENGSSFKKT